MSRATAFVDVAAVGLIGDHRHLGAEPPEDLRSGLEGRTVGTVEQDPPPAQADLREAAVELAQIVLQRAVQRSDATDSPARHRGLGQRRLDLVLGVIVQLVAVGAEQLDPVVLIRVVRGRDHRRHLQTVTAQEHRSGGRRQDTAQQRVAPSGGDAGGDRGLEHVAGFPGVADDQHLWPLVPAVQDRGTRQLERQLRGQEIAGVAPNPVGAEELTGHARVSASRTAASCGPSSGQPSYAP